MSTSSDATARFFWVLTLGLILALMGAPELSAQSTLGSDPLFELGDGLEPPASGIADILGSEQPGPDWDDLFLADRSWRDDYDEFGNLGANGVPDFLDTWGVLRTRRDVVFVLDAISAGTEVDNTAFVPDGIVGVAHDIGNAYAYTAFNNDLDFVLYIGAERLASASGVPSFMLFEFNQGDGTLSFGDIRLRAIFDGFLTGVEIERYQYVDDTLGWALVDTLPVNPGDPATMATLPV